MAAMASRRGRWKRWKTSRLRKSARPARCTVGLGAAWSEVAEFAAAPPRAAGTIVTDEGDGGVKIADYLSEQKFI